MCWSMPYFAAMVLIYPRMDGADAMARSSVHGSKLKPKVKRSLSERMPGYLKRDHVPPISLRPSKMAYLESGIDSWRRYAMFMPEMPPPIMATSRSRASVAPIVTVVRNLRETKGKVL